MTNTKLKERVLLAVGTALYTGIVFATLCIDNRDTRLVVVNSLVILATLAQDKYYRL